MHPYNGNGNHDSKVNFDLFQLSFHQGFKSKIKQNLNRNDVVYIAVNAQKTTVMISILEKQTGEYQKELLVIIREIRTHVPYNMHKIRNMHMFG